MAEPRTALVPGAETERVLRSLRARVEDSDLAHRVIEDRAGFSDGYLSQVLGGHIALKLVHIFAILAALGQDPGDLFRALYAAPDRSAHRPTPDELTLPDDRDVASVFGMGIESVARLRARLERCEDVLTELPDDVLPDGARTDD